MPAAWVKSKASQWIWGVRSWKTILWRPPSVGSPLLVVAGRVRARRTCHRIFSSCETPQWSRVLHHCQAHRPDHPNHEEIVGHNPHPPTYMDGLFLGGRRTQQIGHKDPLGILHGLKIGIDEQRGWCLHATSPLCIFRFLGVLFLLYDGWILYLCSWIKNHSWQTGHLAYPHPWRWSLITVYWAWHRRHVFYVWHSLVSKW